MKNGSRHIFRAAMAALLFFSGQVLTWGNGSDHYAKVSTSTVPSTGAGTAYVSATETVGTDTEATGVVNGTGTVNITLYLKAEPASGYHFVEWTGDGCTFSSSTDSNSSVTVVSSSTDKNAPASFVATAHFDRSLYYARVSTEIDVAGTGTAYVSDVIPVGSATSATAYTDSQGGNIDFHLKATPASGYHFVKWAAEGSGMFNGNSSETSSPEAVFTVSAASLYGEDETLSYSVKAYFEKDLYNAKLAVHVSSAGEGTSAGEAKVRDASGNWVSEVTRAASGAGANVGFDVKATANKGYRFEGWSASDNSDAFIDGLGAEGSYNVQASNVQGGCNATDIYAVFGEGRYSVHFLSNSKEELPVYGEMEAQDFISGVDAALNPVSYVCNVSVRYDAQGGSCATESETKSRFTSWKEWKQGAVINRYDDCETINRIEDDGTIVYLTATWADRVSFTLPEVSCEHYGQQQTFLGWYDQPAGGNRIGGAGDNADIAESVKTLYAHWEQCDIVVNTSSDGGPAADNIVFNVTRTDPTGAGCHYRISLPVNGSIRIKDVPMGTYSVVAEPAWSWDYTVSEAAPKEVRTAETVFDFTVTSRESSKKHSETSKVWNTTE